MMETACAFVDGMKYSDYANDLKTNMAVERAITIIGEPPATSLTKFESNSR